jgi:hypothetical protein
VPNKAMQVQNEKKPISRSVKNRNNIVVVVVGDGRESGSLKVQLVVFAEICCRMERRGKHPIILQPI